MRELIISTFKRHTVVGSAYLDVLLAAFSAHKDDPLLLGGRSADLGPASSSVTSDRILMDPLLACIPPPLQGPPWTRPPAG